MVKSGLISAPYVQSHFRLAIHLLLAIALYAFIILAIDERSFIKYTWI